MNEIENMIVRLKDEKTINEYLNKYRECQAKVRIYTDDYNRVMLNQRPASIHQRSVRIERDLPAKYAADLEQRLIEDLRHELKKEKIKELQVRDEIKADLLKAEVIRHESRFDSHRPEKLMKGKFEILTKEQKSEANLDKTADRMNDKLEKHIEERLAKLAEAKRLDPGNKELTDRERQVIEFVAKLNKSKEKQKENDHDHNFGG